MRCDAHNHLQDNRLKVCGFDPAVWLNAPSVYTCAANGTEEADWDGVAKLAEGSSGVFPAYGLHPWKLAGRKAGWAERLRDRLKADPRAGVGETGLDRWVEGHDLDDQLGVLRVHLELAAELNRPLTVHCLRAWGALRECLSRGPLPQRGFLLHAYGGPAEMIREFVELGAYFSFSTSFADPRRHRIRDAFTFIPAGRLLVETDAPSMPPPESLNQHPLSNSDGEAVNHPGNLPVALSALASLRGESVEAIETLTSENFFRWWEG